MLEQLGMSSIQIGEFGDVADIARSLFAREPANVRAQVMLGLAARQNGQPDSARTWLEGAVAAGSRDIQAYVALAELAVEARDTTGALARYAQALDIYPYLPDAHKARAALFTAAGDTAAAIDDYERLIAQDDAQGGRRWTWPVWNWRAGTPRARLVRSSTRCACCRSTPTWRRYGGRPT